MMRILEFSRYAFMKLGIMIILFSIVAFFGYAFGDKSTLTLTDMIIYLHFGWFISIFGILLIIVGICIDCYINNVKQGDEK